MPRAKKTDAQAVVEAAAHLPADAATAGANMSNRRAIIKSTYLELCALEAKRKEIGAEITSLKASRIKGDLGMKIGDFNLAVRIAGLDGDDRNQCLDTLSEMFEALDIGYQLNWLDAAPDAPKTEAPKEKASKKAKAAEAQDEADPAKGSFVAELQGDPDPFGGALEEDEGIGHEASDLLDDEEAAEAAE